MNYLIWAALGVVVAMLFGAGLRRRVFRPTITSAPFAGAFGALVGGVIGDGVPHAVAGEITISSLVGALIGALVFCWAARARASDAD